MSKLIPIMLFAFAAAITTTVSRAEESQLRFKFAAGDENRLLLNMTMKMEMQAPQQPEAITTTTDQVMYVKLINDEVSEAGVAKQRQIITRMKLTTRVGAAAEPLIDYDSSAAEQPQGPLAEVTLKSIKPLVGAEFRQSMTPRGEIRDVIIPEQVAQSLQNNPALSAGGDSFSATGMKNLVSQAAIVFPDKQLAKNDHWDEKVEVKLPFAKLITIRTITYRGPEENGLERLDVATTVESEPVENAAVSLKVTDGKGSGSILFDGKRGRIHSSDLKQNVTTEVGLAGQTFQQKIETVIKLQLDPSRETQ